MEDKLTKYRGRFYKLMTHYKNGFTLIELLAVIVVLGIIMLISFPAINKAVENSREGAFRASANGIIKSAEFEHANKNLKGNKGSATIIYYNGVESSNVEGFKLNYKGSKPKGGKVIINNKGKVGLNLHNGT